MYSALAEVAAPVALVETAMARRPVLVGAVMPAKSPVMRSSTAGAVQDFAQTGVCPVALEAEVPPMAMARASLARMALAAAVAVDARAAVAW